MNDLFSIVTVLRAGEMEACCIAPLAHRKSKKDSFFVNFRAGPKCMLTSMLIFFAVMMNAKCSSSGGVDSREPYKPRRYAHPSVLARARLDC